MTREERNELAEWSARFHDKQAVRAEEIAQMHRMTALSIRGATPNDEGTAERRYTLLEAVNFIASEWLHVCDVEAQEIANRISGARGKPNRCPDGVQVLEDAEAIFRAAALRALKEQEPTT